MLPVVSLSHIADELEVLDQGHPVLGLKTREPDRLTSPGRRRAQTEISRAARGWEHDLARATRELSDFHAWLHDGIQKNHIA